MNSSRSDSIDRTRIVSDTVSQMSLELDKDNYRNLLGENIPESQANELLQILWDCAHRAVDIGWGLDVVSYFVDESLKQHDQKFIDSGNMLERGISKNVFNTKAIDCSFTEGNDE